MREREGERERTLCVPEFRHCVCLSSDIVCDRVSETERERTLCVPDFRHCVCLSLFITKQNLQPVPPSPLALM